MTAAGHLRHASLKRTGGVWEAPETPEALLLRFFYVPTELQSRVACVRCKLVALHRQGVMKEMVERG